MSQERGRQIVYALRHGAVDMSLDPDRFGWVKTRALLKLHPRLKMSDLRRIVAEDDKGRMELDEARGLIRAVHGHSYHVDLHPAAYVPKVLYHGTSRAALSSIFSTGISSRRRAYVHLSEAPDMAIAVGSRHDERPVVLAISAEKLHRETGQVFARSSSGVWLTKAVPREHVSIFSWGRERSPDYSDGKPENDPDTAHKAFI